VTSSDGTKYTRELFKIDYNHIPLQLVSLPAKARFVNLDIEKRGNRIAYIEGAGDEIPASLEQIGYKVTTIPLDQISAEGLYVEDGGNMIVQYNTNRRLKVDNIGPYPIKLSRARVSVEEAENGMISMKQSLVVMIPEKKQETVVC